MFQLSKGASAHCYIVQQVIQATAWLQVARSMLRPAGGCGIMLLRYTWGRQQAAVTT